jgi:hypothetical protein
MDIAFHIPQWLLWTIGITAGGAALLVSAFFIVLGVAFVRCFDGGLWR